MGKSVFRLSFEYSHIVYGDGLCYDKYVLSFDIDILLYKIVSFWNDRQTKKRTIFRFVLASIVCYLIHAHRFMRFFLTSNWEKEGVFIFRSDSLESKFICWTHWFYRFMKWKNGKHVQISANKKMYDIQNEIKNTFERAQDRLKLWMKIK